ncbi:hypothetical protein [Dickeya fangzhongdai]|uniref:hypothetical protein n=1 Tax=Dickeya fangzhongdai TaxID=1778540 RepID=UPI0026DEA2A0|nr:hypothetical protein [Dickeya fangzhongdai]WKV51498.1 hypothetical protein PL145_04375 [Dickeya fangzhongdai]
MMKPDYLVLSFPVPECLSLSLDGISGTAICGKHIGIPAFIKIKNVITITKNRPLIVRKIVTRRMIAKSAQLLAHFPAQIPVCAMDAVFSGSLRNFLLKFDLGKMAILFFLLKTIQ